MDKTICEPTCSNPLHSDFERQLEAAKIQSWNEALDAALAVHLRHEGLITPTRNAIRALKKPINVEPKVEGEIGG